MHMDKMDKKLKAPKEKRRNMERRKEKSRDAARCRRSKETEIFTDLSSMLPLSKPDTVSHLDKASIIRIAISYLKIRTIVQSIPINSSDHVLNENVHDADSLFLNAFDGFLLVANMDGDIIFISESVNRYLGLSQIDLLGQSLYDISHPCDHAEVKEMLSSKDTNQKSYFFRMKCTLTNKGRNVNIKSASYKVVRFSGRAIECKPMRSEMEYVKQSTSEDESSDSFSTEEEFEKLPQRKPFAHSSLNFVALGEPILHPANIEIPLGQNIFLTNHSLDMKFTYVDEKIMNFFGYQPKSLIDKSVFDYHHAEDSICLRNSFNNLFRKGQSQSESYRFLAFGGGYAWVLTEATIIYNNAQKPQSIVCVNFLISGVENEGEIYSLCQIKEDIGSTVMAENNIVHIAKEGFEEYVNENSPQNLIKTLTSNNVAKNTANELFSPDPPAYSVAVADRVKNITKEMADVKNEKVDILEQIPLCVSEFFSLPSNEDAASRTTTNEDWLLSDQNASVGDFMSKNFELQQSKKETSRGNTERVFNTAKIFSSTKVPEPVTANVFVPFTEDMNKGFVGLAEDNELTVLKDEAVDLTHLAPTAGDVCVPLDKTPIDYVQPDILDEIVMDDAFFNYRNVISSPGQDDHSISSIESKSFGEDFLDFDDLIRSSTEVNDVEQKSDLIPLSFDQDLILPYIQNDLFWDSTPQNAQWASSTDLQSSNQSPNSLENSSNMAKFLIANESCNYYDEEAAIGSSDGGIGANMNPSFDFNTNSIRSRTSSMNGNRMTNYSSYSVRDQTNHEMEFNNFSETMKLAPLIQNQKISAADFKNINKKNYESNVITGAKRSSSEIWDRSNFCKRRKPSTKISDKELMMNAQKMTGDGIQNVSISDKRKMEINGSEETTADDMRIIEEALRTDFRNMDAATWTLARRKILDILGLNGSKLTSGSPNTTNSELSMSLDFTGSLML